MAKYTVYLVRHGQTYFNKYNKMQGWSDSPLTPEGTLVAQTAAKALKDTKFDAAFSSDARRAIDTLKIITDENISDLDPKKIPSFREQFYGYYEGMNSSEAWYMTGMPHGEKTFGDIIKKFGMDKTKDFMKDADPFNDAENAEEYWERLNEGFDKLDEIAKDGDTFLIVSHGTTIRSLADRYGDGSFEIKSGPANSSLTMLERDNGVNKVTSYNQVLK
ncbi:phosphoglycerate mutase [Companilactobacillus sp. RD055328]|uniref:histidine phosphatase family protein n=1 Tax=Companilactobacillus sp. RD055328 TaxID=2916634 RepID=UPI001FC80E15|nr:histidine phosphatase family protein [Companilactobacillus sp. RD055328]GKQ42425.1 phosphoglycerate mutase [Companilactobacillus sp. RD055328]